MLMALSALSAFGGTAVEPLKVAYLYHFTHFIGWPDLPPGAPFVIAVIGDPVLAEALRALERDERRVENRPIRIRTIETRETESGLQCDDCQLLFVGAAAQDRIDRILDAVAGRAVLLVGDSPGLARRGVAINSFLKADILGEGERLRFEMNPAALAGRGLKVSSQLYEVARVLP
ncbi:hypothetical protein CCR95_09955 [Thiocystis minor]|nr:hypothetical protein [Thiocystis minor]